MLAQRTDKVIRQFLAFIYIAAYLADPGHLAGLRRSRGRFDILLIVGVSGGRGIGQLLSGNDIGDEHGVSAKVNALYDFRGNVCVRTFCDIENAVVRPFCCGISVELIYVPAALEAEMFKGVKAGFLRQDRYVKFAGTFDHAVGIVGFVDVERNPQRGVCHLCGGVGDTSVVLVNLSGSDNKKNIS